MEISNKNLQDEKFKNKNKERNNENFENIREMNINIIHNKNEIESKAIDNHVTNKDIKNEIELDIKIKNKEFDTTSIEKIIKEKEEFIVNQVNNTI